jgi:hypothetical protein
VEGHWLWVDLMRMLFRWWLSSTIGGRLSSWCFNFVLELSVCYHLSFFLVRVPSATVKKCSNPVRVVCYPLHQLRFLRVP